MYLRGGIGKFQDYFFFNFVYEKDGRQLHSQWKNGRQKSTDGLQFE
jgi:hypothetical protein